MRTAREIFDEVYNDKTLWSIIESKYYKHIAVAKIEPRGNYYERTIVKLKYEIADECDLLFKWWANCGLDTDFLTEKHLPNILNAIENSIARRTKNRLTRNNLTEAKARGIEEEKWRELLYSFLLRYLDILFLEALLTNNNPMFVLGKEGVKILWDESRKKAIMEGDEKTWMLLCSGTTGEYLTNWEALTEKEKLYWSGTKAELYFILRDIGFEAKILPLIYMIFFKEQCKPTNLPTYESRYNERQIERTELLPLIDELKKLKRS